MATKLQTGNYVHVVATINTKTGDGKILYVNPATSSIESDAVPERNVELAVQDDMGKEINRARVVVRRSSCEPGRSSDVGLIQTDLPSNANMKSVALLFDGREVARYEGGDAGTGGGQASGLTIAEGTSPNRRELSVSELDSITPVKGVTYSILVKPDTGGPWNAIAVGRETPTVELDSNQFPGAKSAKVKVIRTTGFDERTIVEEDVDLGRGLPLGAD